MASILVPLLTVLGVTALAVVGAPAAMASVPNVGPTDPGNGGFPSYYADSNGLALGLCLDGLPNCLASTADFTSPAGEAFYYAADATLGNKLINISNHLEATFAGPGANQQETFMLTQIDAKSGLSPNATYTVTDPYGTVQCTANASGGLKKNECRFQTAPVPQDFNQALGGRIGPFLTWDTFGQPAGAPPAGYIGDNVTPHKVVGSPTGFNKVRVQGPGLTGTCTNVDGTTISSCMETDLFTVQGKVLPGASATVTPNALDFGNTAAPVTQTVTYTSTGSTPVTVSNIATTGADAADYSIAGESCTAAPVAAGSNCTINVTYTPRAGTSSSAALTITDSTTAGTRTVPLTGSSTGTLTLDQTSMTYTNQKVGTASAPQVVTVSNSGVAASSITGAALSGPGAAQFQVSSNGCTTPVQPNTSCEIGVSFAPTSAGAKTATLTLTDSGGKTYPVSLTGNATAPVVTLSPTSLAFADTPAGQTTAPKSVTLTNSGNASVTIDGNSFLVGANGVANQFQYGPTNTCTVGTVVAAGGSCVTQVVFAPTKTATNAYTLAISADGTAYSASLAGTGTAPPDTVAPSVPTGVKAAAAAAPAGASTIAVTWTPSTDNVGVAGYQVFRDGGATPIATVTNGTQYPDSGLAASTTHSYTVKAFDAAGNVSTASTPAASATTLANDATPPTVTTRTPAVSATAVATTSTVAATFSEAVQGVSGTTFTLKNPAGTAVAGTVTQTAGTNTWVFKPTAALAADTKYTATLTGGATAIRDSFNNALTTTSWTFLTGPAPTVTAHTPATNATGVARTGNITATFSEAMTGVTTSTFVLRNPAGTTIAATVTRNGTTNQWILNPTATLAASTRYTVSLVGGTTGVRDVAGNPLAPGQWTFTTGTA